MENHQYQEAPSGKRSHNYGKIHCFEWENSLFQWRFSIAMLVITRGQINPCGLTNSEIRTQKKVHRPPAQQNTSKSRMGARYAGRRSSDIGYYIIYFRIMIRITIMMIIIMICSLYQSWILLPCLLP